MKKLGLARSVVKEFLEEVGTQLKGARDAREQQRLVNLHTRLHMAGDWMRRGAPEKELPVYARLVARCLQTRIELPRDHALLPRLYRELGQLGFEYPEFVVQGKTQTRLTDRDFA